MTTNSVDHADWNYKPLLGLIQRKRFHMILSLLGKKKHDHILEIGYGSGIFMPSLSTHCDKLTGIDIHPFNKEVSKILADYGLVADLFQGSVSQMPFPDESFDLVVSVSAFEFFEDKEAACKEIKRVLKKDGHFILVTPGESWILDLGFKILTKESAKHDFGDKRQHTIPILKEHFDVKESKLFPFVIGRLLPVYKAFSLE